MPQTTAYSFQNVTGTVDGQRVTGWYDGECLTVEPNADKGTGFVGADGSSMWSQSTDRAARITLRLQHTSPTHALLQRKLARQQARGGAARGFKFDFSDTSSGEGGTGEQCYIVQAPSVTKGQEGTVREWTLWTGEWETSIPGEAA